MSCANNLQAGNLGKNGNCHLVSYTKIYFESKQEKKQEFWRNIKKKKKLLNNITTKDKLHYTIRKLKYSSLSI